MTWWGGQDQLSHSQTLRDSLPPLSFAQEQHRIQSLKCYSQWGVRQALLSISVSQWWVQLCTVLFFKPLVTEATHMNTDHGCCRTLGTDMGFDCSLGQGITVAWVASKPPTSAHSFTAFASLSQPLSTGHGPLCIFISSTPIIYLFTIMESNTWLWYIFIDSFKTRVYIKCIYGGGSEEEKNFQTLSLWHVNSIEKYNYYIYSFSISFFSSSNEECL